MAWFYLILAGLMEVGWPVGFNLAWSESGFQWKPAFLAVLSMTASMGLMLLTMAQKTIPVGTIYAVWTGIGSAGAVIVGIWLFKEPATAVRLLCVTLIITGVVGLKLAENN
jgi:quaternary ammonium compound-resistance protein SugE